MREYCRTSGYNLDQQANEDHDWRGQNECYAGYDQVHDPFEQASNRRVRRSPVDDIRQVIQHRPGTGVVARGNNMQDRPALDRRRHNRSLFHIGLYIDPFGWGYQPYSIGYDLAPNYYQQNYWIDPAIYGLPYPPPGMQWVRYYNDALLIDMYSGQVVDAIQGFFW